MTQYEPNFPLISLINELIQCEKPRMGGSFFMCVSGIIHI